MAQPRYEFTGETTTLENGITLRRIRALVAIPAVNDGDDPIEVGEEGGWIEDHSNLPLYAGHSWVHSHARVYGAAAVVEYAHVSGMAEVWGNAIIKGHARVGGSSRVHECAEVSGSAAVFGRARVCGSARIQGNAEVNDFAYISGCSRLHEQASAHGNCLVTDSVISGRGTVYGTAKVQDSRIRGTARVFGAAVLNSVMMYDTASACEDADVSDVTLSGSMQVITPVKEFNPVHITGLRYDIVITDGHLTAGCQTHTFEAWNNFSTDEIRAMDGQRALNFIEFLRTLMNSTVEWRSPIVRSSV